MMFYLVLLAEEAELLRCWEIITWSAFVLHRIERKQLYEYLWDKKSAQNSFSQIQLCQLRLKGIKLYV